MSKYDTLLNYNSDIQIFLHKGVEYMPRKDCVEGKDVRTTLIPEAEQNLMLSDLNDALGEQGLLFTEGEQEMYYDEELQHAAKALEKYQDQLPTVYREVKRAADLGTAAYINC